MSITKNLTDFTGLTFAEPNSDSLKTEIDAIVFGTAAFTGGISHIGGTDDWVFDFDPDPTGSDLTLFNDVIAAHTGKPLLSGTKRLRRSAEQTVNSSTFVSVLSAPFQPGPIVGGDWKLTASVELKMDTAATWGAGGPNKAVEVQITRDGVEVALDGSPFTTYTLTNFEAGDTHVDGDNPIFDIKVRRLGGSGDVKARRMKLEITPVAVAEVEEQS